MNDIFTHSISENMLFESELRDVRGVCVYDGPNRMANGTRMMRVEVETNANRHSNNNDNTNSSSSSNNKDIDFID